ncbi:SPOR domain-containing protein [Microbulbifer sp. CAU 1566]|uniref:SPOR domain-containing protein n=1 Tax=Microbulbifer sp. CAU 1566 TaxID=2933269 RepID=UPI002002A474|nr:SPOR domain-containing protein [Microbulbifer sp. CAU 1566]MCK7595775.1 SPOR domain-containing protein [Microbulbifer sp. CAU 1566]
MASRDRDSDAFMPSASSRGGRGGSEGANRGGNNGANHGANRSASRRRLNDGVKQRIVGALVLAALAVIFLPTLFDREGARYIDVTSQIPAPPDIKPIVIAEPQPVDGIDTAPPVNEVFQPDFVEQKAPAPDPETVTLPPEPEPAEAIASKSASKAAPKVAPEETVAAAAPVRKAEPVTDEPVTEKQPEPEPQLPAEETQLDDQGLPEGWVVQVAAYKESASAERMRGKLMDAGFRAYTRAVDTPKGRFVRVFVGPKLSRVDAQSDKRKLDKLLKTETLILRYRA